jgi:hypothetical protein
MEAKLFRWHAQSRTGEWAVAEQGVPGQRQQQSAAEFFLGSPSALHAAALQRQHHPHPEDCPPVEHLLELESVRAQLVKHLERA